MVTKLLKNYKRNIAYIELAQIKIGEWKETLKKDAITINNLYPKKQPQHLGIEKVRNLKSPTEDIVMRAETLKDRIRNWIKEEKSKIRECQKNVKIIDILLESLPDEDRFLMELKYKEHEKWHIITRKFNKKYRDEYDDYITLSGVKKKNQVIIEELESRLNEPNKKIND